LRRGDLLLPTTAALRRRESILEEPCAIDAVLGW
jgi:hypothetical protein